MLLSTNQHDYPFSHSQDLTMGFVSHAEYSVEGCNGFLMHRMTFSSIECPKTQVQKPRCALSGFWKLYTYKGGKRECSWTILFFSFWNIFYFFYYSIIYICLHVSSVIMYLCNVLCEYRCMFAVLCVIYRVQPVIYAFCPVLIIFCEVYSYWCISSLQVLLLSHRKQTAFFSL